jgi:hypothetical protein
MVKAVYFIHIWTQASQKLSGVSRKRFYVAALPFSVNGVEAREDFPEPERPV